MYSFSISVDYTSVKISMNFSIDHIIKETHSSKSNQNNFFSILIMEDWTFFNDRYSL